MGIRFWDELNTSLKKAHQIFQTKKNSRKIFVFFKFHFHNERGLGPKRYFQVFLEHHKIFLHAKFQGGLTPRSGFLSIDIPFLANMWRKYFSFNISTVVYQSEVEFSDFDQKWAKTRLLLLKILELPISIAWPIVQWKLEAEFRKYNDLSVTFYDFSGKYWLICRSWTLQSAGIKEGGAIEGIEEFWFWLLICDFWWFIGDFLWRLWEILTQMRKLGAG